MHNGDDDENINADKEKLSHESILLQFMHQNEDVIQGDSSRKLRKTTRVFQEKLTTKAFLIKILIQIVKQDLKLLDWLILLCSIELWQLLVNESNNQDGLGRATKSGQYYAKSFYPVTTGHMVDSIKFNFIKLYSSQGTGKIKQQENQ